LYTIFGGSIVPRWESPPPDWVQWVDMRSMFSITDPALADGPASTGTLFGPNLAFRSDLFRQGLRFDSSIGPSGTRYAMGSESELVLRLLRQGYKAWHAQDACVEHFIEKDHLTTQWVLRRAVRFGRGQYRLFYQHGRAGVRWPLYVLPRMLKRLVSIATAWIGSDRQKLLQARLELNYLWGHLVEAAHLSAEVTGSTTEPPDNVRNQHPSEVS
jgi:hypothetical protein